MRSESLSGEGAVLESTRHEVSLIVYFNYPTHTCKFEAIDSLHNL